MKNINLNSSIVILGVLGFAGIALGLHIVQDNYNPAHQLMSELALGEYGSFMLAAFLSLAVAVFTAQSIISSYKSNLTVRILLVIASFSFAGAGVFKLGAYTDLHVGLIAVAFVSVVLTMYLLPRLIPPLQRRIPTIVCWAFGISTAVSVVSSDTLLPGGVAQRMATGCILCWLIWLAVFHRRQAGGKEIADKNYPAHE